MVNNKFKKATNIVESKSNSDKSVWWKLCNHDWGVLTHITLIAAIIVLFSILTCTIIGSNNSNKVVKIVKVNPESVQTVAKSGSNITVRNNATPAKVISNTASISNTSNKAVATKTVKKCISSGTITVDGDFPESKRICSQKINGDLYLQNMNKYKLPCNIYIDGDLFVRNVSQLQFCSGFTVTGNIYVSHKSSFGPIPKNAKIGGQIIL